MENVTALSVEKYKFMSLSQAMKLDISVMSGNLTVYLLNSNGFIYDS